MIDRLSRNLVAIRLRQYVSGRVTNDHLDDAMYEIANDEGTVAVSEMA